MKKILLFLTFISASLLVATDRTEKRIAKLVKPYKSSIDFVSSLDSINQANDHDIFIFFNNNDLYKKKDIRKFHRTLIAVRKIRDLKKPARYNRSELNSLVDNLEKVEKFVQQHATSYYALVTYSKIMTLYESVDSKSDSVMNLIMSQSKSLGLPSMQGRGLYKFVNKIDLDLRRLTALFVQNTLSDDLIVKINALKIKLVSLKSKITMSSVYKSQLNKTRWLKAVGVMMYLTLISLVVIFFNGVLPGTSGLSIAWLALPFIFVVRSGVTVKELNESMKYNIPVHSTSIVSWFRPFWPLTWIPRG